MSDLDDDLLRSAPDLEQIRREGVRWSEPIFVVSAGRSGSTHLANIIGSHPDVALTHESNIAHYLLVAHRLACLPQLRVEEFSGFRLTGLIPKVHTEPFAASCREGLLFAWRDFYRRRFAGQPFTRWADKFQFPEAVPDLVRLFPRARWLRIVRDGRDSALSALHHHEQMRDRREPDAPDMDFEQHCAYWARLNRQLLEFLQPAEAVMQVRYEDLVLREPDTVRAVLAFCGLSEHAD
ncbi:MAG: sulfotransferase, partial [Planctomycetes bacterium]|nr:sulfotransferase [Planctomycetota bacterium]